MKINKTKAHVEEIDALPVSNDYLEQVTGLQERNAQTHPVRPEPYNEYPCPECEEEVRVELPAGPHVTCTGCGTLLSIDADADFDGVWHDRTTLSVVQESPADADAAESF